MAIANDITFQSGAFSPREDAVFRAATEMALEQHLPVVYLAANSGEQLWKRKLRQRVGVPDPRYHIWQCSIGCFFI